MSDDRDLTFALARSVALGRASVEQGASITRRNRAAKQLADAHAAVLAAQSKLDCFRHQSAPTAERELAQALGRFHTLAAIALGLEGT